MNNEIEIDSFKIIGISARTTNENQKSMTDLGQLWNRFYADSILTKIRSRLSDDIYCVYTDYQSDYTGAYSVIIGCKVKSLDNIPSGLTGKQIQGGKYLKYTGKGKMPDAVVNQWKEIWSKDNVLKRKYTEDFEVYGPKSQNPSDAEVDIYIATN